KNGEIAKTGDAFPTAHNQCWPEPPPYILGNQQLQVLQQKDQVTLLFSHSSQVRHVRLNAQHPAKVTPSWYGDSVGRYEGDTLVVDTVGIAVKPLSTVDRYGTPPYRGAPCHRAPPHGRPVEHPGGASSCGRLRRFRRGR